MPVDASTSSTPGNAITFKDVFDAARQAGWGRTSDGHDVEMVHIPFGSIMGPDKKPLKTRSGENVTLASLLEEAIERGTRPKSGLVGPKTSDHPPMGSMTNRSR